jgi:hypothetical protein
MSDLNDPRVFFAAERHGGEQSAAHPGGHHL